MGISCRFHTQTRSGSDIVMSSSSLIKISTHIHWRCLGVLPSFHPSRTNLVCLQIQPHYQGETESFSGSDTFWCQTWREICSQIHNGIQYKWSCLCTMTNPSENWSDRVCQKTHWLSYSNAWDKRHVTGACFTVEERVFVMEVFGSHYHTSQTKPGRDTLNRTWKDEKFEIKINVVWTISSI